MSPTSNLALNSPCGLFARHVVILFPDLHQLKPGALSFLSNSFSPSAFLVLQERNEHHADMDESKREKSSFFSRYHQTLQNLKPFRCSSSKLVSSMTYYFCFHTGVLMFDVWCSHVQLPSSGQCKFPVLHNLCLDDPHDVAHVQE